MRAHATPLRRQRAAGSLARAPGSCAWRSPGATPAQRWRGAQEQIKAYRILVYIPISDHIFLSIVTLAQWTHVDETRP